jgi:hypothetical protein
LHVSPFVLTWNLYAGVPGLQGTDNLIYAQYVIYIGSEEEKTLDHDVWTGGKTPEGGDGAPGGPREGTAHHPMWVRLYIHRKQTNSLYMHKPNTT